MTEYLMRLCRFMNWLGLAGKGIFSGAIVVAASELSKRTTLFGALVVSLPLTSILALYWLNRETGDTAQVADFAESILWLVIPSLALFIALPLLLRRGWEFEAALGVGILVTIICYGVGIWGARTFSQLS